MDFFDVVFKRGSAAEFEKKEIDERLIGIILHAATHAPSAKNLQEWYFVVVKDAEQKRKIVKACYNQQFLMNATFIIICIDKEKLRLKFEKNIDAYAIQDASFAALTMSYAAKALGLDSYIVQSFDKERVARIIHSKQNIEPMLIVAVGYSKFSQKSERIPYENITFVDFFGEKKL